jgi:hypothetical protein
MTQELTPYRPLSLMIDEKLTKSEFNDFIGIWPNFVPKPFCEKLIKYGDSVLNEEIAVDTTSVEIMDGQSMYGKTQNRKDKSFLINYASIDYTYQLNQFLKSCMLHYMYEYSQLKEVSLVSFDLKFQRTPPGGGYHLWHYENASPAFAQREVTWMVYLNDVEDGGETEFQFQKRRIKPTQGTVVLFPAGMTHVHKGNLVLGDKNKYIVTGWYIKTGAR